MYIAGAMNRGEIGADSPIGKTAAALFETLDEAVFNIKKTDFDSKEKRESYEMRKKYADLYTEINKDLIVLHDDIIEESLTTNLVSEFGLPIEKSEEDYFDDSFFYDGPVNGPKFDDVPVALGKKPYIVTFPAKPEWATLANDEHVLHNGVELRHLKYGLCVRLDDQDRMDRIGEMLFKGTDQAYKMAPGKKTKKELPDFGDYSSMTFCQAALLQHGIRMFWPGRSHKVYSDPRGVKGSSVKPAFHHMRVRLLAEYLADVMKLSCEKLKVKIPDTYDWKKLIRDQFPPLRTKAYYSLACEIGLGEPWHRDYFQPRTQPTALPDNRVVKCFEQYASRKRVATAIVEGPASASKRRRV
jgi:hypothetical protein